MKTVPLLKHSLKYAFRLVDIIHLEATKNSIQAVNQMGSLIDFANSLGEKSIIVDLTIDDLTT